MTTGIQSKGVDLDSIFDPYVVGTSPGLTGIQSAGTDIHTRYAPLVYGTAAPATGIACKVGGAGSFVDLNTLFAAKGTAKYALPIDGQTFTASSVGTLNHGSSAQITFNTNIDGAYSVVKVINNDGTPVTTTLATGTWNTSGLGASNLDAQYIVSIGPDGTNPQAGSWSANPANVWTAVTGLLSINDSVSVASTSGTKGNKGTLQIQYRVHSTGQVISNSTIYFDVSADGST